MLQSASHIPLLADVLLLVYILITELMITAYDSMRVEKGTGLLYNCTKYIGCIDSVLFSLGGKNGEVEYTNPG